MSIATIRQKIVNQLQLIDPKLRIYPYIPTNPQELVFIRLHYEAVDHLITYSKTLSQINFTIGVYVQYNPEDLESMQKILDEYVDSTGTKSIQANIELLTPLKMMPDASHVHLTEARDFNRYEFNANKYYGCKMTLECHTV